MRYGYLFNLHLLSHLVDQMESDTVRILDVGCGRCELILLLLDELPLLTTKRIEVFGFDINEHGYPGQAQYEATLENLHNRHPDLDWRQVFKIVSEDDPWPFPDSFFDVVLSNQVIEHVHDLPRFLGEHRRVLAAHGIGMHCFPTLHVLYEWHLLVPLAHRIKDWHARNRWLLWTYRLGMGKRKRLKGLTREEREEFAEQESDYISIYTCYRTTSAIYDAVQTAGLRCTLRFTPSYYVEKFRRLATGGRKPVVIRQYWTCLSGFLTLLFRYLGSVVMTVEHTGRSRSSSHGQSSGAAGTT